MKKVNFVRHYGYIGNVGDKLISSATESFGKELESNEKIKYSTTSFVPYTQFGAFNLINVVKGFIYSIKKISNSDAVVILGGNLLIPNHTKFTLSLLFNSIFAKIFSKKLIIFGVGASEEVDTKSVLYKLYNYAVNLANSIVVRDQHSYNQIAKIYRGDLSVGSDCAFLFGDEYFKEKPRVAGEKLCVIPVSYESATSNEKVITLNETEYFEFHVRLIEALSLKYKVSIVCTAKEDVNFCEQLSNKLGVEVLYSDFDDVLIRNVAGFDYTVAGRMHGIISSVLTENYTVGLYWQNKVKSLQACFDGQLKVYDIEMESIDKILELYSNGFSPIERSTLKNMSEKMKLNLIDKLDL